MNKGKKEYLHIKLSEIKPNPKNEKIHTRDNIDLIRQSIDDVGYINNIIVDEDNVILAGHGRYAVLKEDKVKEIEVTKISGLNEVQKEKFRLYDNQSARTGKYNSELLIDTVAGILKKDKKFNISLLGIEGLSESFAEKVASFDFGNKEQAYFLKRKDVVIIPTENKDEIISLLNKNEIHFVVGYENLREEL